MRKMLAQFKKESGEIAVFVTCTMVLMLLCLGLVVDLGNTYLTHLRMRNAVDLAAIALREDLPHDYSAEKVAEMEAKVSQFVVQNGINLSHMALTTEIQHDSEKIYAAKVILDYTYPHFFAQLYTNATSSIHVGDLMWVAFDEHSGYELLVYPA